MTSFKESCSETYANQKKVADTIYQVNIFPKDICLLLAQYVIVPTSFQVYSRGHVLCIYEHKHCGLLLFVLPTSLHEHGRNGVHLYSENQKWALTHTLFNDDVLINVEGAAYHDRLFLMDGDINNLCVNIESPDPCAWFVETPQTNPRNSFMDDLFKGIYASNGGPFHILVSKDTFYVYYQKFLRSYELSIEEGGGTIFKYERSNYIPNAIESLAAHPLNNTIIIHWESGLLSRLNTLTNTYTRVVKTSDAIHVFYKDFLYIFDEKSNCTKAVDPMTGRVIKSVYISGDPYIWNIFVSNDFIVIDNTVIVHFIHLSAFIQK
jgi:hypothetical protein